MTKRSVLTGISFTGIVFGVVFAAFGFRVLSTQGAQAQAAPAAPAQGQAPAEGRGRGRGPAAPPAPCGPNIEGNLGVNTAKDSRCFELRMYTVDPTRDGQPTRGGGVFKGGINELHKRFREGEVEVFKQSGVEVLAVWQNLDDPNTLIYLLAYKDRAARDAGWAKFNADPKWRELQAKYFVPLSAKAIMM